jgi:hypothetical protein
MILVIEDDERLMESPKSFGPCWSVKVPLLQNIIKYPW